MLTARATSWLLLATFLTVTGCGAAPTQPVPATLGVAGLFTPTGSTVTRVIDGDTIVLADQRTIRVAGIDTPERGQCGYAQATANMRRLTLGKRVAVTGPYTRPRLDRYGRTVAYVTVGRLDAGLAQIKAGLAVARYDGRDGYGVHPRQTAYVTADAKTTNPHCPT